MVDFKCLKCGNCCFAAGSTLYIDQEDVDKWFGEKREDILKMLFATHFICDDCNLEWVIAEGNKCPDCGKTANNARYYWLDKNRPPVMFLQLLSDPRCPFLRKVRNKDEYICKIHDSKPETCRGFPDLDVNEVTQNEDECVAWNCRGYQVWKQANAKTKR